MERHKQKQEVCVGQKVSTAANYFYHNGGGGQFFIDGAIKQ